jgi:anaerobic glycerol-3-phosphate dehydrogenase
MTFDVLVIGGGIAGFAAARAAAARGAKTAVVRSAPGVSALMSGAWLGPLRAEISQSLADAGYRMVAVDAPLPHERGRLLRCNFAGDSHTRATIESGTLVCGINGLPHFNSEILAQLWSADGLLSAATIDLPATPADGWTAASVAAAIERNPSALVAALAGLNVNRIICPAVLGIERNAEVIAALDEAGINAAEALGVSPSIPGWRLLKAIDRALTTLGVTMITGRAVLERAADQRVHELRINGDVVTAKAVVLATGKFTAGGITANAEFRENALDLPVWTEHLGDVFNSPDPIPLTDPVRTEQQPLLSIGVHTDEMQRPADRTGRAVYANVFAAGTIRAGWNAAERGLGDSAEDGWSAGMNASA